LSHPNGLHAHSRHGNSRQAGQRIWNASRLRLHPKHRLPADTPVSQSSATRAMSRQFRSGPICGVNDSPATSDTSNARSGANCSSGPEVNEKKRSAAWVSPAAGTTVALFCASFMIRFYQRISVAVGGCSVAWITQAARPSAKPCVQKAPGSLLLQKRILKTAGAPLVLQGSLGSQPPKNHSASKKRVTCCGFWAQ
jgi:hypothetical protein